MKGKLTEQAAFNLGYNDRLDSLPGEFSMGRTWDDPLLNEAYDRGVNEAERDYTEGNPLAEKASEKP